MSRIGKKPVFIPAGVTVEINDSAVIVKGPKGELTRTLHPNVSVAQKETEDGKAILEVTVKDKKEDAAIWGTMRSHLDNMMNGVTEGWSKALELNGVGFRMNVQGKKLTMALGFSHEVIYQLPEGVEATIENNVMTISGANKEIVGKVASEIRAFKKPEPYKGKGFRYTDEVVRRKAGKTAKAE